jgi:hypothetical protein
MFEATPPTIGSTIMTIHVPDNAVEYATMYAKRVVEDYRENTPTYDQCLDDETIVHDEAYIDAMNVWNKCARECESCGDFFMLSDSDFFDEEEIGGHISECDECAIYINDNYREDFHSDC